MSDVDNTITIFSFERLEAYIQAKELVKEIYKLQSRFPKEEKFALGDQVRRAAVSITANIAEGCGRYSPKEKIRYIEIAFGSMTEVFSELQIAYELEYITKDDIDAIRPCFSQVAKKLSGLRKSLTTT